ncbi:MAG TPA: methylated-DNA--[protein]-cysteine S-methyltransferase [Candidatus Baltobacteraceae bacterium]|nr:methylated-DNA--[protein]-cysteine S-methyltransferase [Candidatus Baltobacteraceae bacterium]
MELYRGELETAFGRMQLAVDAGGVLVETWLPGRAKRKDSTDNPTPAAVEGLDAAKRQLEEYFDRKRRTFELQFEPRGTAFELEIWKRLCATPYGRTVSYGTIAEELGLVNGARAVGRANGANPIPIVIPCHRVIGSNGELVGFGGGLPLKRALLELEGMPAQPRLF